MGVLEACSEKQYNGPLYGQQVLAYSATDKAFAETMEAIFQLNANIVERHTDQIEIFVRTILLLTRPTSSTPSLRRKHAKLFSQQKVRMTRI